MYSMNAVVMYGPTPTLLNKVRDVRWDIEGTEVDLSTRDDGGWGATGVSLKRLSGEIDLLYTPADLGYIALRDACFNGTPIDLQFLDSAAGAGVEGSFAVTNESNPQELEGALTVTFSVKLAPGGAALVP